jgi:hypothetical protein
VDFSKVQSNAENLKGLVLHENVVRTNRIHKAAKPGLMKPTPTFPGFY